MTTNIYDKKVWDEVAQIIMRIRKLPVWAKAEVKSHLPWINQHPETFGFIRFVVGMVLAGLLFQSLTCVSMFRIL